jgi:hypothetical protein
LWATSSEMKLSTCPWDCRWFKKLARYASIKKRLNYSRLDETIMKNRAQKPHFGDIFVFEEVSFLSLAPASRKPILRTKERPPHILLPSPQLLRCKLRVSSGMLLWLHTLCQCLSRDLITLKMESGVFVWFLQDA